MMDEDRNFTTETRNNFAGTRGPASQSCRPVRVAADNAEGRDFKTEFTGSFDNKGYCAVKPVRPTSQALDSGSFDGTSTTRQDYQAWPRTKTQSCKPVPVANVSAAPFDPTTNYSSTFTGTRGERRQPYKPASSMLQGAPFDGTTTTKQDYLPHLNAERAVPVKPAQTVIENVPFNAASTHASDFQQRGGGPRRAFKPKSTAAMMDEDRNFTTETRNNFAGTRGPASQLCRPVRVAPDSAEGRDFKTEFSGSYVDKGYCAVKPVRPAHQPLSSGDFDGSTTNKTDFGRRDGAPAKSCKPVPVANVSDAPFDPTTNYSSTFTGTRGERREPYKPASSMLQGAPFDGTTTTRSDYPAHGRGDRMPIVKPQPTVLDNVPFDGASTHASDYTAHGHASRRAFKPAVTNNTLGEDRDFKTTFRTSYVQYGGKRYAESLDRPDNKPKPSFRYIR
jgi:hypothetical protein